jgi:hypothetical protein
MKKLLFLLSIFAIVLSCSSDETPTPVTPPPAPIVKYTITLSAGEGGTVSTTGGEYEAGQTVSVTATPQGEYLFKDWSDGNTNATRTITVTSNTTLTANFEKKKYPLTVNIEGEGEVLEEIVNSGRTSDYDSGATVKLTAVPSEGWELIGWTGAIESTELEVQLLVSEAKEVNVVFSLMPIEGNLFKEDYSYFIENYKVGDVVNISGVFMEVKYYDTLQSQGWLDWINGQYGISVPVGYISLSPLSCYETSLSVELFFNSYNGEFLMARYNNLTNQNENFHFLAKRYYSDTFTPNFNNNAQAKYFDNIDLAFYESGKYTQELRDKGLTPNKIKLIVTEGGKIGLKNLLTSGIEYIYEDKELTFFECDSFQIIAIADEGYYHSGWSNNSFEDVFKIINGLQEVGAVFKKQSTMNGWYSIFDENKDLTNYPQPNLALDYSLYYFDENILKNIATIASVMDYWNIDSEERAVVFNGGGLGSDYFGYFDYGGNEMKKIDSINQIKDNKYSFVLTKDGKSTDRLKAIKFDFENSKKMKDFYSESGFLSDSIYKEINPKDIRSYISAFFKDIERYGGDTNFKEEDVKVVFENYGGFGAFGTVCNNNPTIYFDSHWWETSITNFYDRQNDGMAVIYHELGHAIFNLDHLCEGGQIMTGWHGAQGGLDCRGEKIGESPLGGVYSLFLPENEQFYNFNRAVKDLVTLNKQFTYDCGTGKGGIIVE